MRAAAPFLPARLPPLPPPPSLPSPTREKRRETKAPRLAAGSCLPPSVPPGSGAGRSALGRPRRQFRALPAAMPGAAWPAGRLPALFSTCGTRPPWSRAPGGGAPGPARPFISVARWNGGGEEPAGPRRVKAHPAGDNRHVTRAARAGGLRRGEGQQPGPAASPDGLPSEPAQARPLPSLAQLGLRRAVRARHLAPGQAWTPAGGRPGMKGCRRGDWFPGRAAANGARGSRDAARPTLRRRSRLRQGDPKLGVLRMRCRPLQ